jgi:hypothetical protein
VAIEGDEVLFRYKDYRDGDQWKTKRMPGVEFIHRFLQHILPKGLRHIRHFGFMGASVHTRRLKQIRELLGMATANELPPPAPEHDPWSGDEDESPDDEPAPRRCRDCGGRFLLIDETPRPTVAELMQMPPDMKPRLHNGGVQLYLPQLIFL